MFKTLRIAPSVACLLLVGGAVGFIGCEKSQDVPLKKSGEPKGATKDSAAGNKTSDRSRESGPTTKPPPRRITRETGATRENPKTTEAAPSDESSAQSRQRTTPTSEDSLKRPRMTESPDAGVSKSAGEETTPQPAASTTDGASSPSNPPVAGADGPRSTQSPADGTGSKEKTTDPGPSTSKAAVPPSVHREAERSTELERGAGTTYRVGRGDTLAMLAEIHYGSQRHLGYLLAANPQITDADHLLVGMVLNIPPLGAGAKKTVAPSKSNAETKPKSSDADDAEAYVVEEGDSFYAIAERVLGDSSRWNELYELNKESVGEDPGRLRVGQSLKIPKPPMPKRR